MLQAELERGDLQCHRSAVLNLQSAPLKTFGYFVLFTSHICQESSSCFHVLSVNQYIVHAVSVFINAWNYFLFGKCWQQQDNV